MKRLYFIVLILMFSYLANAQDKKELTILRVEIAPKIDGILDDLAWKNAQEAKDFIQFTPKMGVMADTEARTIVKMTYDDEAIYVGAYLYDDTTKMMRQITSRDNFGQSDYFTVILNPNNDAQNNTKFFVFSSGAQADALETLGNGEDFGWNAVWDSAVKIVNNGWIVEMKIPYRALRFSNEAVQTWGLQFHRHFRRERSQYTWNPIDVTKGNSGLYNGVLKGIRNIKPPVRLSFYPFTSGLVNTFDGETKTDFKIGLDVKYGITENFTLDATLIPDFSQAGFDNLELNLGPFEQTFSEQRQFFKEGVDLFEKGNLFFSRRVGSAPLGKIELHDNEEITNYPNSTKVLNAAKISGRTKKGLGIGFFNAITEKTYGKIKDTISNEAREELIEPFTNYNIIVLDQQFNKNSSVSLINTNVTRNGKFRDANVTGLLFDVSNKRNTYNIDGQVKMSSLNLADGNQTGYSTFFAARKTHGNYRYSFDHSYADTKYDINDLGLILRNNFNDFGVDFSYRTFEPSKNLQNYKISTYINYKRLANPNTYTGSNLGFEFNAQTKSLHNFWLEMNYQVGKQFDYFEPREEGRYFIYENRIKSSVWFSSNYNKFFAIDVQLGGKTFIENNRNTSGFWFRLSPRIRFNDKFLVIYTYDQDNSFKDRGYTTKLDDNIIFGERDRKTITNSVSSSYNFSPLHSLGLTFRNYWSTVTYQDKLFLLQENGRLSQDLGYMVSDLDENPNINFSTWNLDLNYSWQFAPGSFLTALYRNQLFNSYDASRESYGESLSSLFEQPMQHTFSLRLQYFIDYSNLKKVFQKKNNS